MAGSGTHPGMAVRLEWLYGWEITTFWWEITTFGVNLVDLHHFVHLVVFKPLVDLHHFGGFRPISVVLTHFGSFGQSFGPNAKESGVPQVGGVPPTPSPPLANHLALFKPLDQKW